MIGYFLKKLFGTKNERELKNLWPYIEQINTLEPEVSQFSLEQMRTKTLEFKERLQKGESLESLLIEAFAVVREAAKRTIEMRHFDVQLIGGIVLHQGKIAEMATGEGKTLVATLSAYLNALSGQGVHIVTVNDYLAKRDREWMGPIYEYLGLTVGCIQHDLGPLERQKAYQCDITYGTNNEFGFDYLRDNMCHDFSEMVQRGFNYAIVDEVDSILIDEARTPLIISGPTEETVDKYYEINRIIPLLKVGQDYELEEKTKSVSMLEEGVAKVERLLRVENLYDERNIDLVHHVLQGVRAHKLYQKDVDYVVKNGEVIIVDEFTGRLMPGRRYSDGLHQALEAKEGVKIATENQTLATITFQNYFKLYKKLAGMTGTADTEALEFHQIYGLDVVVIPTNQTLIRYNNPDVIYRTEGEKFNAAVEEIVQLNREGRPVLVGTISIEKSERLSKLLKNRGIPHQVLNAKYHEKEADIVALAGQRKAVTIATNMAGRGTDIKLGPGIAVIGGLHILGTERHEARRIDNQLRGRAGRQGDPGSSRFYLSLEDDLLRLFGSDRLKGFMERMGMDDGEPIEHRLVSKSIEGAQKRVEAHNFEIRKHLLEYDNVMNQQRQVIYQQRRQVLEGRDLKDTILNMMEEIIEDSFSLYIKENSHPDDWDLKGLKEWALRTFGIFLKTEASDLYEMKEEHLLETLKEEAKKAYDQREKLMGQEMMRRLEQLVLLQTIDTKWKDHLYAMDQLREGIGLRAYGQRDPLVEYKQEAFDMFNDTIWRIKEEVVSLMYKVQVRERPEEERVPQPPQKKRLAPRMASVHAGFSAFSQEQDGSAPQKASTTSVRVPEKIGRNAPCPCGSGKKYKKCCGA